MKGLEPHSHCRSEVINGENHRVPCAQQLQTKSTEVDPAGRIRKANTVRLATKEVGLAVQGVTKKNEGQLT